MPKVDADYLAARRQHIMDSSRVVFARNGFHATSMTDLLGASGLSAGAFYRYFDSKHAIVEAIAQEAIGDVIFAIARTAATDGSTIGDVLAAAIEAVAAGEDSDTDAALAVQAWGEALRNEEFGDYMRAKMGRTRKALLRVIRANQRDGLLPADVSPQSLLTVFFAVLPGVLLQRAVFGGDVAPAAAQALRALWPSAS